MVPVLKSPFDIPGEELYEANPSIVLSNSAEAFKRPDLT